MHELVQEEVRRPRLEHIRAFERLLTDEWTTVVTSFLHHSREEQRNELERGLDPRFPDPQLDVARLG